MEKASIVCPDGKLLEKGLLLRKKVSEKAPVGTMSESLSLSVAAFMTISNIVLSNVASPEQLLGCHYVHASIHKTGSKFVPQRMPRHALDSRFLARQSEARPEIQ
jgi:hypothetical protein